MTASVFDYFYSCMNVDEVKGVRNDRNSSYSVVSGYAVEKIHVTQSTVHYKEVNPG